MRKVSSQEFWIGGILRQETNSLIENVRNGAAFRCIEAVGQAIAYGMNTQTTNDPMVGL